MDRNMQIIFHLRKWPLTLDALKSHSNNIMFLSVSIFRMVQELDKHRNLYFDNLPWFGQPPKPIEFGPD